MTTSREPVALTRASVATLAWCVRVVKRLQLAHEQSRAQKAYRAREQAPVRFGKTIALGEDPYPDAEADPKPNVFGIQFVDRTFAETVGAGGVTETPWATRFRKGRTFDGAYLDEGTLCKVYRIRNRLWLEPIQAPEGECDPVPKFWSQIEGWDPAERQALMHAPDECPKWVTVAPCTEPE